MLFCLSPHAPGSHHLLWEGALVTGYPVVLSDSPPPPVGLPAQVERPGVYSWFLFFFSFSDWRASVLLPVSVVTQERLQKEACDKGLHPGPAVSRCSCPLGGNASLYLEGSPGPFLWGQRAQGRTGSAPAPWSRGSIGPGSGGDPPRSAGTWAAPVLVRSSQGSTQPPDWGTGLGARQPSSGDCCSH